MSNLHSAFAKLNTNLSLTETKTKDLKTAEKALMASLKSQFKLKEGYSEPRFYRQGSFKMQTAIRTQDDICDLDLGVYFSEVPSLSNETIQSHIVSAIENHTNEAPNHKKRCVRVNYSKGFHIDLPIYFFTNDMTHPELFVKGEERQESDPKEFFDWFNDQCIGSTQKRRLIRYLKAWADKHKNKMPSGLALTVLAIEHYVANDRDDLALIETAKAVKSYVNATWSCFLPACPNDDVLARLDMDQKANFINSLGELIEDLQDAIDNDDEAKAYKKCDKIFGKRFPETPKTMRLFEKASSVLAGSSFTNSTGQIDKAGIKNKPHKFYGEE